MSDSTVTDTQAPALTFLNIPAVIDLLDPGSRFLIAGATDVGQGVRAVVVTTDLPVINNGNGYEAAYHSFRISPDTDNHATYTYADWNDGEDGNFVWLNTNGDFRITEVTVIDLANNTRVYTTAELEAMGVPTSFQVINSPFYGSAADELMHAGSYNLARGLGGDDTIIGADGDNTAAYAGPREQYTVSRNGEWLTVADATGREGIDRLLGIEDLRFGDMGVSFDLHDSLAQVTRLFEAFDRSPSREELRYWTGQMDGKAQWSLLEVSRQLTLSPEFQPLYGTTQSFDNLVASLYQNVLGREGSASDIAYWADMLGRSDASVADVLVAFSESPEGVAASAQLIGQGIEYTLWWTL